MIMEKRVRTGTVFAHYFLTYMNKIINTGQMSENFLICGSWNGDV
jgi:hypothetical protein